MPPALTDRVDSGRVLVAAGFVDAVEWVDVFDVVRTGDEIWAMAEPGLAGRFLAARAFFWAIMASRRLGLLDAMVLLDNPRPGRAGASVFLGEFGLFGSLFNSF